MSGNASEKREQGLLNRTTGKITATLGILFAAAGFEHGLFAALQGNKPTDGLIIQAIGESMQSWEFGGEEALTIIPNFLVTGICAMCVSVFIIIGRCSSFRGGTVEGSSCFHSSSWFS